MPFSDEQIGTATRDFLGSIFYQGIFQDWLDDQKKELIDATDRLIREDAPKNKFAVISGKRQMIQNLEQQLEVWANRDKINK